MKFAKVVFWIAGGVGVPAAIAMYFNSGPYYYYGSLAGLVAWQPAFFLIATDPRRFRPMMIPSMIEKLLWVATLTFLHFRGQLNAAELSTGIPLHALLGALFIVAFIKTPRAELEQS